MRGRDVGELLKREMSSSSSARESSLRKSRRFVQNTRVLKLAGHGTPAPVLPRYWVGLAGSCNADASSGCPESR